jgi:hypothetical protein
MRLNLAVEIIAIGAGVASVVSAIVTRVRAAAKEAQLRELVEKSIRTGPTGQKMSQKARSAEDEADRGGSFATPRTGRKISRKRKPSAEGKN